MTDRDPIRTGQSRSRRAGVRKFVDTGQLMAIWTVPHALNLTELVFALRPGLLYWCVWQAIRISGIQTWS